MTTTAHACAHPRLDNGLDHVDRCLINALHGGFPLTGRPYADIAGPLGISESEVIARLQRLLENHTLTRFGPLFQIERMGGTFCLCALAVPEGEWARVVGIVNAFPEVAHNYRREHRLNMWFVLATEIPDSIGKTIAAIEHATALEVLSFPKEREYFVELKLEA